MYEPYIASLSARLLMPVAPWTTEKKQSDNWKTTAWARISADVELSPLSDKDEKEHF